MNADNLVPREVVGLIETSIPSIEHLDILCYLLCHHDTHFTSAKISQELRISHGSTARKLEDLAEAGFVEVRCDDDIRYRFAPADPRLKERVVNLDRCYRTYRHRVIELVVQSPRYAASVRPSK